MSKCWRTCTPARKSEGSATAWIELHQAVWTHRKTFELASILGIEDTYAAAHVIRLWSWALDNAPDGDLSHLSSRAIAYGAGWRGSSETLLGGLLNVGWLNADHTIHDWHEYAGRLIERREKDAERKRLERKSAAALQDVHGTANGTATGVRRTVPDRTLTGPNRTGPDPLPPTPSPHGGEGDEPTTKLKAADKKLWERTRERLRSALSAANWELLVEPLEPLGRGAGGALFLRAPPDLGIAARVATAAKKALVDEGEPVEMAKLMTIVEGV